MLHERFKPRLDLRRDLTQALDHECQGENSRPEKKSPSPQGSMVESGLHRHADLLFWVAHVYFEGFVLRDIETIRQPDWQTYRSHAQTRA